MAAHAYRLSIVASCLAWLPSLQAQAAELTKVELSYNSTSGTRAMFLRKGSSQDLSSSRPKVLSMLARPNESTRLAFAKVSGEPAEIEAGDGFKTTANGTAGSPVDATPEGFRTTWTTMSGCTWGGSGASHTVTIHGVPSGTSCASASCTARFVNVTYGSACPTTAASYTTDITTMSSSNGYTTSIGPNTKRCYMAKQVLFTPYLAQADSGISYCQCSNAFPPTCSLGKEG